LTTRARTIRARAQAGLWAADPNGFAPSAERAALWDTRVRAGLARSLKDVFRSLDRDAADPAHARFLAAVETGPVRPAVFAGYVELVLAVFEDRVGDAHALADELLAASTAVEAPMRPLPLDDVALGPGVAGRYARLISDDALIAIAPASPEAVARAAPGVEAGLDLLRRGAPDVWAEVRALIREIVVVSGQVGGPDLNIAAASCFSLWGALILVADKLGEPLDAALVLAHEAAHTHLFGLAEGGVLVENPDDERRPAPFRSDLRPLEGLAHAAFVYARTAYACDALLRSGALSADEAAEAERQLKRSREGWRQAADTVEAHGRFTPAGRQALAGARHYMADGLRPTPA